ncbi:cytochrome c biogenesis protein ResB [bacterium]|nr:cytochrome c biogenesis protein ResB [bacterium]
MASTDSVSAAESRAPVLRPPTPREQLESLHPIERGLYRIFEFASSLKLAITLMVWLMIECAIGTRIESTINAAGAKYFVYGNPRFYILLALLALNVLSAALIRFPWKRYQTGFVITHVGLLTILAGSMITSISHVDALLNVSQGEVADTMIHPDQDIVRVGWEDPGTGKQKDQAVAVQFGPLTWGSKILGFFPWGKGHEEVLALDEIERGAKLRVKKFIAHCDWNDTYVPDKVGVPAVSFTLSAPSIGNFEQTAWVAARPTEVGFIGDEQVSVGGVPVRVRTWRAGSQAELDHFVSAAPKGEIAGTLGQIGLSHAGKHFLLTLDDLKAKPFEDPSIGLRVELIEQMPHAQLDPEKKTWRNAGPDPEYPAVRLKLSMGDLQRETIAFANNPEFARPLAVRGGLPDGTFVTYFRPDHPSEVQFLVTAGDQLGYRAFSSQACVASVVAELNKAYPSFGMFELIPRAVLASGRPDVEITPKPVPPGEQTFPAIEVEFSLPSGTKTVARLVRQLPETRRVLDGKIVSLRFKLKEEELPFAVRLDDFNEPKQPGTMNAARYESFVTVFKKKDIPSESLKPNDPLQTKRGSKAIAFEETRKAEIKMNHPLFFKGETGHEYTLYQSGITRQQGIPVSTYTVAYDPGLIMKYAGAIILCVGIFLMFYMGGYFRTKPMRAADAASRG